ncbi:MAG: DinB family protein, partial [Acidobacteriota bacterium]
MHTMPRFFAFVTAAALLGGVNAFPQSMPPAGADPAHTVQQFATRVEDNLLALAKAIPADKYNFAPSKEIFKPGSDADFATVRTIAQQFTHVASMPYHMLPAFGVKPDAEPDLNALNSMTSKDDIVKALQASFDYQNKVIASLTAQNAFAPTGPHNMSLMGMLLMMMNDYGDHYGQLVEYGRMNG